MPGERTIVVVEDEPAQRHLLVDYLARQGFKAIGVTDGAALRRALQREELALVLLDVGLPGEDGISLARYLREHHPRVGIIMVTAAGDTVDRVIGLETGADDYIPQAVRTPRIVGADQKRAAPCPPGDRHVEWPTREDGPSRPRPAAPSAAGRGRHGASLTARGEFESCSPRLLYNPNRASSARGDLLLEATSHRQAD